VKDLISRVTSIYAIDLVSGTRFNNLKYYLTLNKKDNVSKQIAGPFISKGPDYLECFKEAWDWHKANTQNVEREPNEQHD